MKNNNFDIIEALWLRRERKRRAQKIIEGAPPLTFKAKEGTLKNYRIYGQTVDGESVGDLETAGEHAGEYKVPVTVEGKNLLLNTVTSQEINGVTFTVNSDGSVTCNNTATANSILRIGIYLDAGVDYILSGCLIATNEVRIDLRKNSDVVVDKDGRYVVNSAFPITFQLMESGYYDVCIRIVSGYICDNLTFYPMIRKADISDDTYEPYQPPVTTPIYLPEPIKMVGDEAEYIDYAEQKQHRVRKNLLRNTASAKVTQGYSIVVDNDGTITIDGYFTNTYDFAINGTWNSTEEIIKQGNYTLSNVGDSIPSGIRVIAYDLKVNKGFLNENTSSALITNSAVTYVAIQVSSKTYINNLKLKIMIRKADIDDDTYEPYIINTELDVALPALPTLPGTNTLSVGTEVQPSKVIVKGKLKD